MGDSYYLFSSGELKRKDNTLQFIKPTGEKRNLPIEVIYDIYAFGEITINTKLINFYLKREYAFIFLIITNFMQEVFIREKNWFRAIC